LTAGSTATFANGLTVHGACGFDTTNSRAIGDESSTVQWVTASGGVPRIQNNTIGTISYRIIVFHT
jgi:hypothetical protein